MVASFELLDQTSPKVLLLPDLPVTWTSMLRLYCVSPFDLKLQLLATQTFQICTDQQDLDQGLQSVTAQEKLVLASCTVALLQLNLGKRRTVS